MITTDLPQYDDMVEITLETVIQKEDEILVEIAEENELTRNTINSSSMQIINKINTNPNIPLNERICYAETNQGINACTTYRNIPYVFREGSCIFHNGSIYLIGGDSSRKNFYKYNIIENTYTKLINLPNDFFDNPIILVDNDIYMFGSFLHKKSYKYNLENEQFVEINGPVVGLFGARCALVEGFIYIFGNRDGSSAQKAYKYDIKNDVTISIADIPIRFNDGLATSHGKYVYLFGGFPANSALDNTTSVRRYDTVHNTYENAVSCGLRCDRSSGVKIKNLYFLFSGYDNSSMPTGTCWLYNLETQENSRLISLPSNVYDACACIDENNVAYLLGGAGTDSQIIQIKYPNYLRSYGKKTILLKKGTVLQATQPVEYYSSSEVYELEHQNDFAICPQDGLYSFNGLLSIY